MFARIGLAIVLVVASVLGLAHLNRKDTILHLVSKRAKSHEIAVTRPIEWSVGPEISSLADEERPPNIIFILADDLGINDISTFGGGVANGLVPTPNIDRLAADGAIFQQAYSGTGTCAPSRAMLMTVRYPTRTGFEFTPTPDGMTRIVKLFDDGPLSGRPEIIVHKDRLSDMPAFEEQGLPGFEITIAEVLKSFGYYTAHIGKWHLGRGGELDPNVQGFDDSLAMASGMFLPEIVSQLETLLANHQATAVPPLYPYVAKVPVSVDYPLSESINEDDLVVYWPN